MNSLLDHDRDEDIDHSYSSRRSGSRGSSPDREITLGTTMVLGIFFALAVFGAVFFGFGYSMGAKHAAATGNGPVGSSSSSSFTSSKPAPGSPVGGPAAAATNAAFTTPTPAPVSTKPASKPVPAADSDSSVTTLPAPLPAPAPAPLRPTAVVVPAATPVTSAPVAPGQFMVQVVASSHEEDAEGVVTALKRKGYNVAIRTEPQDKFFHVQIGPFATRAEANAMSQRVLGDGFHAIVK